MLLKKLLCKKRKNSKSITINDNQIRELIEQNRKIYCQNLEQTNKIISIEDKVNYLYEKQELEAGQEEELNNSIITCIFRELLLVTELIIVIISIVFCIFEFLNSCGDNRLINIIILGDIIGIIFIGLDALATVLGTLILSFGDLFVEKRKKEIENYSPKPKRQKGHLYYRWKKNRTIFLWGHFISLIVVEVYLIGNSMINSNITLLSCWLCGMIGYVVILTSIEFASIIRKANHTILFNGITLVIALGSYLLNQDVWYKITEFLSNIIK